MKEVVVEKVATTLRPILERYAASSALIVDHVEKLIFVIRSRYVLLHYIPTYPEEEEIYSIFMEDELVLHYGKLELEASSRQQKIAKGYLIESLWSIDGGSTEIMLARSR